MNCTFSRGFEISIKFCVFCIHAELSAFLLPLFGNFEAKCSQMISKKGNRLLQTRLSILFFNCLRVGIIKF
jgi:hypothetical protein